MEYGTETEELWSMAAATLRWPSVHLPLDRFVQRSLVQRSPPLSASPPPSAVSRLMLGVRGPPHVPPLAAPLRSASRCYAVLDALPLGRHLT